MTTFDEVINLYHKHDKYKVFGHDLTCKDMKKIQIIGDRLSHGSAKGVWKYFFPNGKLHFEGKFVDGLPDGKHKYYFESGKIKREENYIMGVKTGNWKSYNELGELSLIVEYKNGENYKINGSKIK